MRRLIVDRAEVTSSTLYALHTPTAAGGCAACGPACDYATAFAAYLAGAGTIIDLRRELIAAYRRERGLRD